MDKKQLYMYFIFMKSVQVYDLDINLELKYYPSRE